MAHRLHDRLPAPGESPGPSTLDRLYDEFGPRVERWVRRLAGPTADVEDLVHDVFVVALRQRGGFRGEARVSTWLFGITRNLVRRRRWRDRLRGLLGRRYLPTSGSADTSVRTPLEEVESQERALALYRALDRLPETDRTVLVLYDLDGCSAEEVAELLGLRTNAVWVRVHRARGRLLAELTKMRRRQP